MNPGLLRDPLSLERKAPGKDTLGQPLDEWVLVVSFRGRRMRPKIAANLSDQFISDREQERQQAVFQVRSQPFLASYQDGDRLVELPRKHIPAVVWEVTGWAEVDGTGGAYIQISVERDS